MSRRFALILAASIPSLLASLACTGLGGADSADEGCTPSRWYRDQDGDGHGDPDRAEAHCEAPSGFVADDGDCDDEDPDAHPGATERCDDDDVDEDCDGDIDEDDDDLEPPTWYADSDRDGFGDADSAETHCDAPSGFVDNADDCDDDDRKVNPDAQEVCDGGTDEDCDGLIDSDDDSMDPDIVPTWYRDADGDGFGSSTQTREVCEAPSGYADNDEDCDDSEAGVNPDAREVCGDDLDNNCNGAFDGCGLDGDERADAAGLRLTGPSGSSFGLTVAGLGDVDADGHADVAVGAPYTGAGAVYGFYGGATGSLASTSADVTWSGSVTGDGFGAALAVGDVDGSGRKDLLVGAPYLDYSSSYTNSGRAYVFTAPYSASEPASGANYYWYVTSPSNAKVGWCIGTGDWNGDGDDDVFLAGVGATSADWVAGILTPLPSAHVVSDAQDVRMGDDYDGIVVSGGDLDGDGLDDAAWSGDTGGVARGYIVVTLGGWTGVHNVAAGYDEAFIQSDADADHFGEVMSLAGDADGDGYADLLVGASGRDDGGTNVGAAYLYFGPVSGPSLAPRDAGASFSGGTLRDAFGTSLAYIGDENADGDGDLAIGAPGVDAGATDAGAAYLYPGPISGGAHAASTASARLLGTSSGAGLGGSLAAAGDVNDDGNDDILVGASEIDAAYVFFGGGY